MLVSGGSVASDASPWLGLPAMADAGLPGDRSLQIELGRQLFQDPILAADRVTTCATCHVPEHGFTVNNIPTATGRGGIILPRNAPSLLNVGLAKSFFRDGRILSLEEQVWGPLLNPDEQANSSIEQVMARLEASAAYDRAFKSAFAGQRIAKDLIGAALAAYERSLVAGGSPFDRWYFGNDNAALTPDARAGFGVFQASGCGQCHSIERGFASFSDDSYRNTGIEWARINGQLGPLKAISDLGRYAVTGREADRYSFRVPTLRNVALTFPYMHDGSLTTLREVIDFYDSGSGNDSKRDTNLRRLNLSEQQKLELIAFLESLSSGNAEVLVKKAREPFANR